MKIKRKKRKKKGILHQEIKVILGGKELLFIVVQVLRKTRSKILLSGLIVICQLIMLVLGLLISGVVLIIVVLIIVVLRS